MQQRLSSFWLRPTGCEAWQRVSLARTYILKQTGSYEQPRYAIQGTPEMIANPAGP
ncbi:hypothetical protein GOC57_21630, partial [Sinorhizobium meliloti]|nr:hypothetical protein [Sinorhizobium meliloti]MDW9563602.1 hypothetical protein [Sinorhizobium meliloti]MDW9650878.1 hypothetical protein [Sinorhizobium meliloti]MDW9966345.1 hypothetical protein [Sinorhizobium meliloti]MDX0338743.1 hypothetical protein [Sinorhizobium meliloti]